MDGIEDMAPAGVEEPTYDATQKGNTVGGSGASFRQLLEWAKRRRSMPTNEGGHGRRDMALANVTPFAGLPQARDGSTAGATALNDIVASIGPVTHSAKTYVNSSAAQEPDHAAIGTGSLPSPNSNLTAGVEITQDAPQSHAPPPAPAGAEYDPLLDWSEPSTSSDNVLRIQFSDAAAVTSADLTLSSSGDLSLALQSDANGVRIPITDAVAELKKRLEALGFYVSDLKVVQAPSGDNEDAE